MSVDGACCCNGIGLASCAVVQHNTPMRECNTPMHFTSSFTLKQTATKRHPTPEQYGPFVINLIVTKRQAGILEKKQPGPAWRLIAH